MNSTANQFVASASAIGYAYQFRCSLLHAWRAVARDIDWQIAIEAGDDIEFRDRSGVQYEQLKHRAPGSVLQDASDDLWKTIRVWSGLVERGDFDPGRTRLMMMTTAAAAPKTVAEWLAPDVGRDPAMALSALDRVAANSKNISTARQEAYAAWKNLSDTKRRQLVQSAEVYASASDIQDVHGELLLLANLSTRRSQSTAFLEMVEGWWFQRCLRLMASGSATFILGDEVDSYLSELRERFANQEDLPVDPEIERAAAKDHSLYADKLYVQQLNLAEISDRRVKSAVNDYLRAFAQRSQWLRQGLLYPEELDRYEHRLMEEWQLVFDRNTEDLDESAAEAERMRAAKEVYAWVEQTLAPPIRSLCTERFLVRGSLHILADDCRVGWHPDFMARLISLLEPASVDQ